MFIAPFESVFAIIGRDTGKLKFSKIALKWIISLTNSARATYSASAVENATIGVTRDDHAIGAPLIIIIKPNDDLRSGRLSLWLKSLIPSIRKLCTFSNCFLQNVM